MAVVYVALGSVAYRGHEISYLFCVSGIGTHLLDGTSIQLKQIGSLSAGQSSGVLPWVGFHLDSNKTRRSALLIERWSFLPLVW